MYPGEIEKQRTLQQSLAPLRMIELERRRISNDASRAVSSGNTRDQRKSIAERLSAFLPSRMSRSTSGTA